MSIFCYLDITAILTLEITADSHKSKQGRNAQKRDRYREDRSAKERRGKRRFMSLSYIIR